MNEIFQNLYDMTAFSNIIAERFHIALSWYQETI